MRWYAKALLQRGLSLVPGGRRVNLEFQRRYGQLRAPDVPEKLTDVTETFLVPLCARFGQLFGLHIIELGTGWVPVLPLTLALAGARCRTFDVARLLERSTLLRTISALLQTLELCTRVAGFPLEHARNACLSALQAATVDDMLETLGVSYVAPADTAHLPATSDSQDATVTNLVLQHIAPLTLPAVARELYRITKPNGVGLHKINLHDEYAQGDPRVTLINFLRYPGWFWERFGNHAIKYVNRARYPYYLEVFRQAGFRVVRVDKKLDPRALDAIPTMRLAREFRHHTPEELATIGLTVLLEKPP